MQKRVLAALLTLAMLLGMLAIPAAAAETATVSAAKTVLLEAEKSDLSGGKILQNGSSYSGSGYVGDFYKDNSASFPLNVETAGEYRVLVRAGTAQEGCAATISVDGGEAKTISIDNTGDWQNYQLFETTVSLETGNHTLKVANAADNAWNIDCVVLLGKDAGLSSGKTIRYEAEDAVSFNGKVMENGAASGGKYIGDFYTGNQLDFGLFADDAGRYRLTLAVATEKDGGACEIYVDGVKYTREFTTTKGWQSYVLLGLALELSEGYHSVSVVNTKNTWNVDYLEASWIEAQTGYAVGQKTPVTITATEWENASGIFNETANVGGTDSTDWFDYTLNVADQGVYTLTMEVACGNEVGAPYGVRVASSTGGSTVASVPITGGWQEYKTVTAELRLTAGVQKLTFTADY